VRRSLDYIFRVALWVAYRLLRLWWYVRQPHHEGAVIAIWLDDKILMVRHSYRARLSWPGGSVKRGEAPVDAARRELHEELGLVVGRADLSFVSGVLERWEDRRDHVHIFEMRPNNAPQFRPDGREVIGAEFMTPQAALAVPLVPFIRTYLEQKVL